MIASLGGLMVLRKWKMLEQLGTVASYFDCSENHQYRVSEHFVEVTGLSITVINRRMEHFESKFIRAAASPATQVAPIRPQRYAFMKLPSVFEGVVSHCCVEKP